jgi:histidinol-phosphatase (PHP family)
MPAERACRAAAARGLKILGLADHAEFLNEDEAYIADNYDGDKIFAEIKRLRKTYEGKLEILFGVEIGYIPGMEAEIEAFCDKYPFDYAIGSVHYVDGALVSRWVREREFAGADFMPYFEMVLAAAQSGLFDILGHLDYVRKYLFASGNYDREKYEGIVGRILDAAVKTGLALEINTSGWRHFAQEPYPGAEIFQRFSKLGKGVTGEGVTGGSVTGVTGVTVGSDAHKYFEVGYGQHEARELLRNAGFESLEVFRQRKRCSIPL